MLAGLLRRLIGVASKVSDEYRLKEELIRNLRGEKTAISVAADRATSGEIIRFLFEKQERDELLTTLDETIAGPLRQIGSNIDAFFADFHEPKLDDPRKKGKIIDLIASPAESLVANVARDAFREREEDLDFLERFLGDPSLAGPLHRFRWALLTGPAGQGKTRLAIEFLARAEARLFRAGFLSAPELLQLQPRRWRPPFPTLIVIDYPAQHPDKVHELLDGFASEAAQAPEHLPFPVRVLLLEREAEGDWFETLAPPSSNGCLVRKFAFGDPPRLDHALRPLSRDALLAIMRGRLRTDDLSDAELFDTLVRVDPHHVGAADGERNRTAPSIRRRDSAGARRKCGRGCRSCRGRSRSHETGCARLARR